MGEYFDYNSRSDEGKRLIAEICRSLGDSPETVAENVVRWSDVKIGSQYGNPLTDKEIDEYLANVGGAKNYQNSPYVLNDDEKLRYLQETVLIKELSPCPRPDRGLVINPYFREACVRPLYGSADASPTGRRRLRSS